MKNWLRRVRGALGMGLTWAFGWGLVGGAIEAIWEIWPGFPLGPLVDIWPFALAIPGFLGGALFSVVLGIAARHRRFDELSFSGFGALGALGGGLLGGVAVAAGLVDGIVPALVTMGTTALLSAGSASATLALAKMSAKQELTGGNASGAEMELLEGKD